MIKVYFKLFFWLTFFCFLGTLAANLNMAEGLDSILGESATAIVFGLLAAALLGAKHARGARKAAGENPEGDIYAVDQSRQILLPLPYDRAFHVISHYLKEVARLRILGADPVAGVIDARTPSVFFVGMGSSVTARLTRDGEATMLTFRSRPTVPLSLVDDGTNLKIVTDAQKYLADALHR
ncbi:MAG: hypothetical protein A2049_11900 [Elusimicrobia bacterium GWA2_62_23]|nr:MAG: hypothetical protein A2049_11900 [Elusimicrobia bacterium GWA2_62_23]